MNSQLQNHRLNLEPDKRVLINQIANRLQPEKKLQEVIDHESVASSIGQYAQILLNVMPETIQKAQPIEYRKILPILICARNEEISLPSTLKNLMNSAIYFQKNRLDFHVAIIISNNFSYDETTAVAAQFYHEHNKELVNNHISIEVIYEGKPGKINALKSGITYIRKRFAAKFTHVIFSDADVDWDEKAMHVIWEKANTSIGKRPLLVGSNIRYRNRRTIWGALEECVYWGYGSLPPRNQGVFMKFISGMGYIADASVLFHFDDMNEDCSNEDVALSALVGHENIYIAADAIVRYDLSEDWSTFKRIRARHVRNLLRLEKWFAERYGEEKALEMISSVAELGVFKFTDRFFTPTVPLSPLDGSFYEKIKKIIRHIYSVPAANYPLFNLYLGLTFMPTVYPYLIFSGIMNLYMSSWKNALVGFVKKLFCSPYITFMKSKKPQNKDEALFSMEDYGKGWDPYQQRKKPLHRQYSGRFAHIRAFLSNNMNWSIAIVMIMELFIYEFILRHTFLFVSGRFSTATNNMRGLFDTLSKATFYIGHHIPLIAVISCVIIYIYLFGFHFLQSIKNKEKSGGKLVDSLRNTNKKFFKVLVFPFIAFEKIFLFPVIVFFILTRLLIKKAFVKS
ncbi:MAG: glycosyltransferase [Syntrophaceae bacterium]|nr:glycosyltransferase [Syntrophaceae bacterium]